MTHPQPNVVETTRRFVALMQDPQVTVTTLALHLGRELYHERPDVSSAFTYYFAPADPRFQYVTVDQYQFSPGGNAPYDLELTLADHAVLHLHDLSQAFGQWHRLPMIGEAPPSVEFKLNAPHQKYRLVLDVDLDALPQGTNPRVKKLTIFRYANFE